ncbi:hypothetical protein EDF48_1081, partial [Curtobacterium sp. PhB191]
MSDADQDRLLDEAVAAFYSAQVEHAHLMQHLAVTHDLNPVDLRALKFLGAVDDDRTPKCEQPRSVSSFSLRSVSGQVVPMTRVLRAAST